MQLRRPRDPNRPNRHRVGAKPRRAETRCNSLDTRIERNPQTDVPLTITGPALKESDALIKKKRPLKLKILLRVLDAVGRAHTVLMTTTLK
jgi:hypothetical protein